MPSIEEDKIREERIEAEVLVDAHDKEERAMGWYYYLDDLLNVPFKAKWVKKGGKTPAKEKEVEVVGMAPDDECERDMLVEVVHLEGKNEDVFSAKLSDIQALDADNETQQAIADWHYWVGRGYKF